MYIPPEEKQQPKSWEQTNKRRGKETKIIKLNDKELQHHSPVNLDQGGGFDLMLHSFGQVYVVLCQPTRGSYTDSQQASLAVKH